MLADARELLAASQRLGDSTTASYARQLIRMLSHVAPFLIDDEGAPPSQVCLPALDAPPPQATAPRGAAPQAAAQAASAAASEAAATAPADGRAPCSTPDRRSALALPTSTSLIAAPSLVAQTLDAAADRRPPPLSSSALDAVAGGAVAGGAAAGGAAVGAYERDESPRSPLLFPLSTEASPPTPTRPPPPTGAAPTPALPVSSAPPASSAALANERRRRSRPKSHTISSFEILKPISRGAYGHVVLAAMKTTRDLYAIKVLRKTDMRRKNQVALLQPASNRLQLPPTAEGPLHCHLDCWVGDFINYPLYDLPRWAS